MSADGETSCCPGSEDAGGKDASHQDGPQTLRQGSGGEATFFLRNRTFKRHLSVLACIKDH